MDSKLDTLSPAKKKPVNVRRGLFIISFIILPTIHFFVFYVYVNLSSFTMAFQRVDVVGKSAWTLEWFARFFNELKLPGSELNGAFVNTFKTFLIAECMLPVGFAVSYFLYKKILFHRAFKIIFFMPSIIAGTIIASVYMEVVGMKGPIVPLVQRALNLEIAPDLLADSRFANYTIWANMIWLSFPGNMIIWGGALSRIPESVLESAKLDGVGILQEAIRIIIPIIWPMFGLQLMLSIISVFGATGQVFLLTQGQYGTMTFSVWMYLQVYKNVGVGFSNSYNYMSAVGLMISAVAVTLSIVIRKIAKLSVYDVTY